MQIKNLLLSSDIMITDEIIDYVQKNKSFTAFEVTPTSKDFNVGDHWDVDISMVPEWNESTIYANGDIVRYNDKLYYATNGSGKEQIVVPGTNQKYWKLYENSSYEVKYIIPQDNIHVVVIRNYNKMSATDIVVDWGDGEISRVSDLENEVLSDKTDPEDIFGTKGDNVKTIMTFNKPEDDNVEHFIGLAHRYDVDTSTDRSVYVVKIYGEHWGIIHNEKSKFKTTSTTKGHNLISRCIDWDLPISDTVLTLSNGFEGCNRLFKFAPREYTRLPATILNFNNMFKDCKNLQLISPTRKGQSIFNGIQPVNVQTIFQGCINIQKVEGFRLPIYIDEESESWGLAGVNPFYFEKTSNLNLDFDVLKILPRGGFVNKHLNCIDGFTGMSKITCSNYNTLADILWKNPGYSGGNNCFKGCTSMDLTKIPISWGGTLSVSV